MWDSNSRHIETGMNVTSLHDHTMIRKPGARQSQTPNDGFDLAAVTQVEAS